MDEQRTRRKRSAPRATGGPRVSHFVKGGAFGFAALAAARWLLRNPATPPTTRPKPDSAASDANAGTTDDDQPE